MSRLADEHSPVNAALNLGTDLRREAQQRLGEFFGAPPQRLAHGILHRLIESRLHSFIGLDAEFAHLLQRPYPHVIFLLAADAIAMESDGVVADFVQEDG